MFFKIHKLSLSCGIMQEAKYIFISIPNKESKKMSEKNGQHFPNVSLWKHWDNVNNSDYKKRNTRRSYKVGNSSTLTILWDGLSIREGMTEDRVSELWDNKQDLPNLNQRGDTELRYINRAAETGGKYQSIHHQNQSQKARREEVQMKEDLKK